MAFTIGAIAAKDGNGSTIGGGLLAADTTGGGSGPFFVFNGLVDGVAGSNKAQISAANALKVDGSAVTQPISGTITANAGTNLNTSTLALETGGNLATAAAPVGTFGSAMPAKGSGIGLWDGTNMVHAKGDETSGIWVNIKAGSGSGGTAIADEAAFTEGATSITPIGGVFKSSHTALTSGQAGVVALTAAREMMVIGKLWDGTNTAAVKAASTAALATDPAVVVTISPNGQVALGQHAMGGVPCVSIASDQSAVQVSTISVNSVVTPTVTASSAYTAGNEVGGLMTFAGSARSPNFSGIVQDVTLTFKSAQTTEFDFYLFIANPTNSTWTDKTGPAINSADVNKLIGVCKLTKAYSGLGTHTLYKPDETTWAPVPFVSISSGTSLYGVLVAVSTPTFGSTSDATVTLGVLQD